MSDIVGAVGWFSSPTSQPSDQMIVTAFWNPFQQLEQNRKRDLGKER